MHKKQGRREIDVLIVVILIGLMFTMKTQAQPTAANLTKGNSSRGTNPSVQSAEAQAGNVTRLNIDQTRITDVWQGYYGNVSGEIVLENAAGDNFYDWQYTSLTGEVYATREIITDWTAINCTNSTQWEAEEATLNIVTDAIDGINETYNQNSHDTFQVGARIMENCPSTRPYNGSGVYGEFWNVLLNSDENNTVYTAVLAENENAFDNSTADFEILVPVNRTTSTATYYIYVELE